MSVGAIGGLYAVGAIANLLSLPLTDLGTRRLGRLPVLLGSTLCMIVALVLLAAASAPPAAWLAATLMGAAAGLAGPVLSAYAIDAAPGGAVGAASGTLRTVIDTAFITAPVVTGVIVERSGLGYAGGLGFAGVLLAATTLVFISARTRRAKG
jgi:MFS family permease